MPAPRLPCRRAGDLSQVQSPPHPPAGSAALRETEQSPAMTASLLLFVSMKEGLGSSVVRAAVVRARGRCGGGELRSSLYRPFSVGDRAEWEVRSGGAFPKRAVRRLDENGRLPERRAGCG